jgi:hypothetical protein
VCDRRLHGNSRELALRAIKGIAIIALGIVRLVPLASLRGATAAVTTAAEIARGAGMLSGLVGASYQAYRRPA